MGKNNEYLEISKQIVANIGGMDNIQGTAHCATRLRIVLKDNDLADIEKLEDIDKVKGAFIAGNQLQLILGAGTVNFLPDGERSFGDITQQRIGFIIKKKSRSFIRTKNGTETVYIADQPIPVKMEFTIFTQEM